MFKAEAQQKICKTENLFINANFVHQGINLSKDGVILGRIFCFPFQRIKNA